MGIFLVMIGALIFMSEKIFEESKTEDGKDGTKIIMLVFSFLMCLYTFILQIPITTILFQGFLCEEDLKHGLVITDLTCQSVTHKVLIVVSSLLLIIYLAVLFIQTLLYSSNGFEQIVPWASYERTLALTRAFIKLLISMGFVFDKKGDYRGEFNLVLFFLQSYIVIRRYQVAIIFNNSVFYATVIYEGLSMWLYLTISMHILTDTPLSISSFLILISIGLFLSICLVFLQQKRADDQLSTLDTLHTFRQPIDYMLYFFRLYQVVEDSSLPIKTPQAQEANQRLQGMLRKHMSHCEREDCKCAKIGDKLDDISMQREIMKKEIFANIEMIDAPIDSFNNNPSENSLQQEISGNNLNATTMKRGGKSSLSMMLRHQYSRKLSKTKQASTKMSKRKSLHGEDEASNQIATSWLQQKRMLQKAEETLELLSQTTFDSAKLHKRWNQLLALYITDAIHRFPKNIDIRVINAFIQKTKLNNEFKAIFEMMKCELAEPSIYERFIIFRKKIEVEQTLVVQHQKNILKVGCLDPTQVLKYEKWYAKYQLYEYLATYSAQCFWKELLQKQVDASVLQEKGSDISEYYKMIQDIVQKLNKIYPEQLKFMYRYGNFLMHIIHNEYDALEYFIKAQITYQSRLTKKSQSNVQNEHTIFGENSASGIVIISASSNKIGLIIHSNEELESVLGYKRNDLMGKNVSSIMPPTISKAHDRLVQRYFETAKPTVIETRRQLFAVTKLGYIREIQLLVKVYPQVASDKIVFIGLVQTDNTYSEMEPPKTAELEAMNKEYIITDRERNVTNVTDGVHQQMGLHPKFFKYTDSIFQQMFNLDKICPDLSDKDLQEQLESEGAIVSFDTRFILNVVDLESLTSDEIVEVRASLGQYQAYVQLKRVVIHPEYCVINIYRVIFISKYDLGASYNKGMFGSSIEKGAGGSDLQPLDSSNKDANSTHHSGGTGLLVDQVFQQSVSSLSSGASNSVSFNKVIKDFKRSLSERKTPRNLVFLNRLTMLVVTITLVLSIINFNSINSSISDIRVKNERSLKSEERSLGITQLASNVRSMINIANKLEENKYDGLENIERFQYLSDLVQEQASELREIHEYLTQMRQQEMSYFEYEPIQLYRLDDSNLVSPYNQPYRVALLTYLNHVQRLNSITSMQELSLPLYLFKNPPIGNKTFRINETTSEFQKSVYFLMINGLREVRFRTQEAHDKMIETTNTDNTEYIVIMIVAIVIIIAFFTSVIYSIWLVEENKADILSLYSFLTLDDIEQVSLQCSTFLDLLNDGSLTTFIHPLKDSQDDQDTVEIIKVTTATGNPNPQGDDQVSEEEKEAQFYRTYAQKRKQKQNGRNNKKPGDEMFSQMIRQVVKETKAISERDEQYKQNVAMNASQQERHERFISFERQQAMANSKKKKIKKKEKKERDSIDDNKSLSSSNKSEEESSEKQFEINKEKDISITTRASLELSQDEQEQRTKDFQHSIKKRYLKKTILSIFAGAIFLSYFIFVVIEQQVFSTALYDLTLAIPQFFNRYRHLMISYMFIRERVINNNSLDSFHYDNMYKFYLDQKYIDLSIETENSITQLKSTHPAVLKPLIKLIDVMDSPEFCNNIKPLANVTEIENYCLQFYDGLFQHGAQQAISNFHKKFTDLQIRIRTANNYEEILTLINPPLQKSAVKQTTISTFFIAQELYFFKAIKNIEKASSSTFNAFVSEYQYLTQTIFVIFVIYQCIILTIVRGRLIALLKEDIFKNKGILNLIPDTFFETNRERVEKIIKKLKN